MVGDLRNVVGYLRKIAKNVIMSVMIISYSEKEITWSLLMLKILEEKFDIYAQPCNILYFYITKISASLLLSKWYVYILDCEVMFCVMPSFGKACSITIPMNINPEWKISLGMIPCLKCSRERILISMTLRRKTDVAVVITAKPVTNFLQFDRCLTGDVGVIYHHFNQR